MKRLFSTLFCLLLVVAAFAQNAYGHLRFMGIPITGTIAQFQAKLVAKGCTYDKVASSSITVGTRAFKGSLARNKVDIYAYYNTQTKIVYRVKAVINGISEDHATQKYYELKSFLTVKYDSRYTTTNTEKGKEATHYLALRDKDTIIDPNDPPSRISDVAFGMIDLYITEDEEDWRSPYNYNLHIDYYDQINGEKNSSDILDEL